MWDSSSHFFFCFSLLSFLQADQEKCRVTAPLDFVGYLIPAPSELLRFSPFFSGLTPLFPSCSALSKSPSFSMAIQSKLTVYRGFVGRSCYAWSPFVNKLETRLRLAGVKYDTEPGSLSTAPRGKVPYISIEGSPELLGDSTLITRRFVEQGFLPDLNAGLTPVQRAQDLALRSLFEDKLYFYQESRTSKLFSIPFFL